MHEGLPTTEIGGCTHVHSGEKRTSINQQVSGNTHLRIYKATNDTFGVKAN